MEPDFSPFFDKYEKLVAEVDGIFERVSQEHADCMACKQGCSDCCHAMFDLTLVEALYLHTKFDATYEGQQRSDLLDRADLADRKAYKIKRDAFKLSREGAKTSDILELISKAKVRCPLLGDNDCCDLYEHRPLTCRLYGIPTAIRGKAHTCGLTGFEAGKQYPTVQIEKIQDRLIALSFELTSSLRTRFSRLAETMVPVSMALMNKYDGEYLGLLSDEEWEKIQEVKKVMQPEPAPEATPKGIAEKPQEEQPIPSACASCSEGQGSDACSTCGSLNWELGGPEK